MTTVTPTAGQRSEIAFFDLETTLPGECEGFAILEFGAILVCPRTLVELHTYATFVQPAADPSLIFSSSFLRSNGITYDNIVSAPTFSDIADTVYEILNGRLWAGHNVQKFDSVKIREAFAEIGRQPPVPKGVIDTWELLTHKFGRRAGDMKMASLATYFGLGKQTHRSLDDVRMNVDVLKCCATVLLLVTILPYAFVVTNVGSTTFQPAPFSRGTLGNEMNIDSLQQDAAIEPKKESSEIPSSLTVPEGGSGHGGFLEPDEVSVSFIRASFCPHSWGVQRMVLLYKDVPLQLHCSHLRVRYNGLSTKFADYAGRPRLSFVVDAPPNLYSILDACDKIAQKVSAESGSSSKWKHVVTKHDFDNSPTVRLHIPTEVTGDVAQYATEIFHKDSSETMKKHEFSRLGAAELNTWFRQGTFVAAYFSLDPYDYLQEKKAGIRLVAKKLIMHQY
ncbi:exonuclease, putative [Ricinus communis]|uniref:Exonuclease, putative n=1 Tax=Ricinus communis TaxID=3988 RepID=B9RLV7_RICCO|nr:exonuclease, putative [Ricinus communis]